MELMAMLYVRCADARGRERLAFYLDEATRPDFPDEVPAEEADLVRAFESVDAPAQLLKPSATELVASFEMPSGDTQYALASVLGRFGAEKAIWHESDGGELNVYYCYRDGDFHFLYSPQPLDDPEDEARYNRALPQAARELLNQEAGMAQAVLYLGRLEFTCPG